MIAGITEATGQNSRGHVSIAVENGTVTYYRNDMHFYTSSKPVEYPLYLGALLADQGAAVADATAVPSRGRGVALQ